MQEEDVERAAIQDEKPRYRKKRPPVVHINNGHVDNINAALSAAKKRGSSEEIVENLRQSVESAILPVECKDCSGFGAHMKMGEDKSECTSCNGTGYENHKEMNMAAKKKSSSKKKSTRSAVAREPGRERKLLLRLSKDEYNSLQAKAAKQEISMAALLRSAI